MEPRFVWLIFAVLCSVATPLLYKWADEYAGSTAHKTLRAVLMTVATIFLIGAVVTDNFALKEWLQVLLPGGISPTLRIISYFGGAAIFVAAAVVFYFRRRKFKRGSSNFKNSVLRNTIAAILAAAIAFGLVATAIVGLINPQAYDGGDDTGRTDFVFTMDEEDLAKYAQEKWGYSVEELARIIDTSSLFEHRQDRIDAVLAAGASFHDPVSTPMKALDTLLDENAEDAAMEQAIRSSMSEVEWLIMTNVHVYDMVTHQLKEANDEIGTQNSWLDTGYDELDAIFAATDPDQRGFRGLTVKNETTGNYESNMGLPQHFWNRIRLVAFLDSCFTLKVGGVENRATEKNWHDNGAVDNSDVRFVESSHQENGPSIILYHQYKFPTEEIELTEIGFNVYDKRSLIPAEAEKKDNHKQNTGTTVKRYTLTAEFVDTAGNELSPSKTDSYKYKEGEQFTAVADKIPGWTPDRESVTDVMPGHDHTVRFVYTKDEVKKGLLTVRYWKEYVGGEYVHDPDYYRYAPGRYTINLPWVNRYQPVSGLYTLTFDMPAGDKVLDVVYTYLYEVNVAVIFADTGLPQAGSPIIEWHVNGDYYHIVPVIPDGYYAEPPDVTGWIQGADVFKTIWLYPKGQPADGNDWKDDRVDPINENNANRGGNTNPLGSGTGDEGRGSELVDGSKTPPYVPPASSGTTVFTEPPVSQGDGQNTEPPAEGTDQSNQSTVTTHQGAGTSTNPSGDGDNKGIIGAPPD